MECEGDAICSCGSAGPAVGCVVDGLGGRAGSFTATRGGVTVTLEGC